MTPNRLRDMAGGRIIKLRLFHLQVRNVDRTLILSFRKNAKV